MIELRGISFAYTPRTPVLAGVDLVVPPGLTLLLGPNGCGKSTLLKIAAGVERPDSGKAAIEGHDLWTEEVAARQGLAYVPEQPDLSPYASVLEILRLVCRLRGRTLAEAEVALHTVGLDGHGRRSVRELSMGQRRRAVLAAALIGSPRVVLLDEPLEALDRAARATVVEWVRKLLHEGATVVVATHDLEPFVPLAARAVAMSRGEVRPPAPLPAAPGARLELLDHLARGEPGELDALAGVYPSAAERCQ